MRASSPTVLVPNSSRDCCQRDGRGWGRRRCAAVADAAGGSSPGRPRRVQLVYKHGRLSAGCRPTPADEILVNASSIFKAVSVSARVSSAGQVSVGRDTGQILTTRAVPAHGKIGFPVGFPLTRRRNFVKFLTRGRRGS